MIIQIWHARNSDFQIELYNPIKKASFFPEHIFIFPHDEVELDSRASLKSIDLFIAEVSTPATGLGIEIGFASAYGKSLLCIYKKWSKISASLKQVTENFIEYDNVDDMVNKVALFLDTLLVSSRAKGDSP
jgi:nucleoside 2-deoxyribosyltransferase